MSDRVTNLNRNWRDEESLRLGGANVRDAERRLSDPKVKTDFPVVDLRDGYFGLIEKVPFAYNTNVPFFVDFAGATVGYYEATYKLPGNYKVLGNVTIRFLREDQARTAGIILSATDVVGSYPYLCAIWLKPSGAADGDMYTVLKEGEAVNGFKDFSWDGDMYLEGEWTIHAYIFSPYNYYVDGNGLNVFPNAALNIKFEPIDRGSVNG